jgi:hypothetical protein
MGRTYRPSNDFKLGDSNTICDVTGFKVKKSEVRKRWDGFYVIADAWHARHPQDTPVIPKPERVVSDTRTQSENTDAAAAITII